MPFDESLLRSFQSQLSAGSLDAGILSIGLTCGCWINNQLAALYVHDQYYGVWTVVACIGLLLTGCAAGCCVRRSIWATALYAMGSMVGIVAFYREVWPDEADLFRAYMSLVSVTLSTLLIFLALCTLILCVPDRMEDRIEVAMVVEDEEEPLLKRSECGAV